MKYGYWLVLIVSILGSATEAQVVAAWDFSDARGAGSSPWNVYTLSNAVNGDVSTVNGISLTVVDGAAVAEKLGQLESTVNFRYADGEAPLVALSTNSADQNVFEDWLWGFDGTESVVLSGLAERTTYNVQVLGSWRSNAGAGLTTTIATNGSTSRVQLIDTPVASDVAYSEKFEFVADASGTFTLDFIQADPSKFHAGLSGLMVEKGEAVVEPPPPPPVITHTTVIEGGTNLVMTWTSKPGQLFDVVKSSDMKSWRIFEENYPASASTQTTYAVALDESAESQFYQVWSVKDVPPNIILLFADDLGFGDLACYGHPYAKTPNLDTLARQGTLFREFNVTGMTCNPSRTGILSSWHPNSYHLNTAEYGFDQAQYDTNHVGYIDHPTVMELLHNAGYKTGHFGKWHIGPVETNGTYGIDEVIVSGGGGSDPRGRDEEIYRNAIDFIVANQHTNFYINVMGRVTHSPVDPRPDLVTNANFHTLAIDRADFPGQQIQDIFDGVEANGGNITNSMRNYLTEVYYLDQFIGELLDKLDELNLRENTIVAFSSDQGAAVPSYSVVPVPNREYNLVGWSGGLRGQKHDQHEGGVRSPFILRWPGYVPAGKINTESNFSALDWLPTLCGIAGVDISGVTIQGEDVRDIWEGADRSRNDPQFWNSSMKKDNWRAYFQNASSTNMVELFDLSTDLSETNNLVGVRPDKVAELTAIWQDWIDSLP